LKIAILITYSQRQLITSSTRVTYVAYCSVRMVNSIFLIINYKTCPTTGY